MFRKLFNQFIIGPLIQELKAYHRGYQEGYVQGHAQGVLDGERKRLTSELVKQIKGTFS